MTTSITVTRSRIEYMVTHKRKTKYVTIERHLDSVTVGATLSDGMHTEFTLRTGASQYSDDQLLRAIGAKPDELFEIKWDDVFQRVTPRKAGRR